MIYYPYPRDSTLYGAGQTGKFNLLNTSLMTTFRRRS